MATISICGFLKLWGQVRQAAKPTALTGSYCGAAQLPCRVKPRTRLSIRPVLCKMWEHFGTKPASFCLTGLRRIYVWVAKATCRMLRGGAWTWGFQQGLRIENSVKNWQYAACDCSRLGSWQSWCGRRLLPSASSAGTAGTLQLESPIGPVICLPNCHEHYSSSPVLLLNRSSNSD